MREMKRQFVMRWDEMLLILGLQAGFFLFGEILLGIVVYGVEEKESIIQAGTMLALFVPVFVMVFTGMSSMPLCFNLAVGMGAVRRHVVPAMIGMSLLINMMVVWIAYLFYNLEQWIFGMFYAGIEIEFDLQFVFHWKYILPVCLAVTAVNILMGAMFLKYGKIAFTIFWIVWMAAFIGGPRLGHLLESAQDNAFLRICRKIVELISGFSERGILSAVALVSAGLIFVSWMLLRRQEVNI